MSDTSNPYAAGFFFAGSDPAHMKMREKIALAQMMQKRAIPKNLGEGIYTIGQEIGDALAARSLTAADKDAQLAASKLGAPADPGSITPLSQAPQEIEPPPPTAAAQRIIPAPGNLPPTGEPGNTGANTFQPPFQPPPGNPPPAAATPPPAPRSWPTPGPIAPPQPYPPPASVARPSVADFGQKPVLAPTPPPGAPVVAQGREDDPRRDAALALLRQGQTGQPQSQAFAPAATPPLPPPPTDQGVKPAPPVQMAQGQPAPVPGYVTPEPSTPAGAAIIQPTRRERELTAVMAANQGNPYAAQSPAANELQRLTKDREIRQTEQNELFKERAKQQTELIKLRETGRMDQAGRIVGVEKEREAVTEARQKNALRAQFGNMPPDEVFKSVTESHKVANSAAKSLQASQAAMAAFNAPGGVITGSGANARLDVAKFFTQMGLVDKGNVIANTETFRNAMAPVVASIMHQTSGTSQLSEGELRFAQRAAAGDITLDPGSIKQLMSIIDKGSKGIIADHQRKVDVLFGDSPQAKATFGVEAPKAPEKSAPAVSEGATATGPGGKKMIMRGGNWEPL